MGSSARLAPGMKDVPTDGVIGSSTSSRTKYTRSVAMDIIDSKSLNTNKIEIVYEMRAQRSGKCGAIVVVFDGMLEAMFKDFPGESGKARRTDITIGEFDC